MGSDSGEGLNLMSLEKQLKWSKGGKVGRVEVREFVKAGHVEPVGRCQDLREMRATGGL